MSLPNPTHVCPRCYQITRQADLCLSCQRIERRELDEARNAEWWDDGDGGAA